MGDLVLTGRRLIVAITGSRGEWGYIRPILRLIDQDPDLDYAIIATNMHLLPEFGMSVHEIERDGFRVDERIYMTLDGYTGATMTKSLACLLLELPTVLQRIKPDMLLLSGDRGEQLMAAIAGQHLRIPIAHIQAGELSGNVDGVVRHAITKLAHIHFVANKEFAERVRRLGEQEFRIHLTGAPLVDELVEGQITPPDEIKRKYRLNGDSRLILAVQHPVTEEEVEAGEQVTETLHALIEIGWPTILIYPNADAGSDLIRKQLVSLKRPHIRFFRNLPRADYLGLIKTASVMVGNSSSGIMEAPTFGTPCVNIGCRQKGRPQASNVINVGYSRSEIAEAIQKSVMPEMQAQAKAAMNPYGQGGASKRIVAILKGIEINEALLRKEMTY
jgi:GDP/UDP-N,N'-diacetylbacillosamine 2-epimerase (hydrolysing)